MDLSMVNALVQSLPGASLAAIVSGVLVLWLAFQYLSARDKRDSEERAKVFEQWQGLEVRREERHAKQIEVLESLKVSNDRIANVLEPLKISSDRVAKVLEHCERQTARRDGA